MLAHLVAEALAAGFPVVILETGPRQPEALALYVKAGYGPIAPLGHYADRPTARVLWEPRWPTGCAAGTHRSRWCSSASV